MQEQCIFFHDWNKWKQGERQQITRISTNEVTGYFIIQTRTCERCGKMESETIKQEVLKN